MIVGIFATWDWSLFEPPEAVFQRKLDANPIFPFTEVEPNIYMLTTRSKRVLIGIIFCIITLLTSFWIYDAGGSAREYYAICVVCFIGFVKMAVYSRESRTIVLDGNEKMYEFYKGDELVYRGHYHNIYIRLKGDKTGSGEIYFNVVVNGFNIDEEAVTGASTTHRKLFKLGRRLAHRLDLNFFDYQDKSRNHVIRNTCPYLKTESQFDFSQIQLV